MSSVLSAIYCVHMFRIELIFLFSREVMNRFQGLPFMRGRGGQAPGGAVQMQQSSHVQQDPNFGSQHTYIPPGDKAPPVQYPPPQQPYPAGQ